MRQVNRKKKRPDETNARHEIYGLIKKQDSENGSHYKYLSINVITITSLTLSSEQPARSPTWGVQPEVYCSVIRPVTHFTPRRKTYRDERTDESRPSSSKSNKFRGRFLSNKCRELVSVSPANTMVFFSSRTSKAYHIIVSYELTKSLWNYDVSRVFHKTRNKTLQPIFVILNLQNT